MNYDDPQLKANADQEEQEKSILAAILQHHKRMVYSLLTRDEELRKQHRSDRRMFVVVGITQLIVYLATQLNYWFAPPERQLYNGIYWLTFTILFATSIIYLELVKLRKRKE